MYVCMYIYIYIHIAPRYCLYWIIGPPSFYIEGVPISLKDFLVF